MPASALGDVRCQKTVCKLEMTWTSEASDVYMMAFQRVREYFSADLGMQPEGAGNYDDEMKLDLYIPRKGYTLADLDR